MRGIGYRLHKTKMLGVAGLERTDMPEDWATQKSQISNQIEHLVSDELVTIAESVFVENRLTVPVNGNDIFQSGAEGPGRLPIIPQPVQHSRRSWPWRFRGRTDQR